MYNSFGCGLLLNYFCQSKVNFSPHLIKPDLLAYTSS